MPFPRAVEDRRDVLVVHGAEGRTGEVRRAAHPWARAAAPGALCAVQQKRGMAITRWSRRPAHRRDPDGRRHRPPGTGAPAPERRRPAAPHAGCGSGERRPGRAEPLVGARGRGRGQLPSLSRRASVRASASRAVHRPPGRRPRSARLGLRHAGDDRSPVLHDSPLPPAIAVSAPQGRHVVSHAHDHRTTASTALVASRASSQADFEDRDLDPGALEGQRGGGGGHLEEGGMGRRAALHGLGDARAALPGCRG